MPHAPHTPPATSERPAGGRPCACRACGAPAPARAFAVRVPEGRFELRECAACASLTLDHAPAFDAVLRSHAPGAYHGPDRRRFPGPVETLVARFRDARARWVARDLAPGARVLDIGCGRGLMLAALARRGFRVAGTEIGAEAAAGAAAVPGIELALGEDALERFAPGSFGAVCLFHTLEHMPDPPGVLDRARALLEPGGRVFLEVPLLTPVARRFGPAWFHLDAPRHLVSFSAAGLEAAWRGAGLRPVEVSRFSLEMSPPSLFLSLARLALPRHDLYAATHAAPGPRRTLAALAVLAGSAACLIPALALAGLGQGDVLRACLEPAAGSRR